jgi:hypothetical protein
MLVRRSITATLAVIVLAAAAAFSAASPPPAAAYDYSPGPGTLLWLQTWHPSRIFMKYGAVDMVRGPGGDLWVGVGGSTSAMDSPYIKRICVARYSPSGGPRWQKVLPSPVEMTYYGAIAVDRGRNAVVVGQRLQYGLAKGYPWVVQKLSPSGRVLWTRTRSSPAETSFAWPHSVATDSAGSIYVVGQMTRTETGEDLTLVKYSAGGAFRWARYIDGYEGSADTGLGVAVDPKDRVYVTGTVGSFFSGKDVVMARYTTAGKRLWKLVWDGDGLDDVAVDIDANAAKVAVAANMAEEGGLGEAAILVAEPDMTGKTIQERVTGFVGRAAAWADIDVNAAGDIAAAGTSGDSLIHMRWSSMVPASSYAPVGGSAGGQSVALSSDGTLVAGGWQTGTGMLLLADTKDGDDWQATSIVSAGAECTVATSSGVYAFGQWGNRFVLVKVQM